MAIFYLSFLSWARGKIDLALIFGIFGISGISGVLGISGF
jgi:hypothetical protein